MGVDDDANGAVDDLSELAPPVRTISSGNRAMSFPTQLLPAALQGYSNYDYSTGLRPLVVLITGRTPSICWRMR